MAKMSSLVRVMQETAGAPDLESFRHALFKLLDEELDLPLIALNFSTGRGPMRIGQSRQFNETDLRSRFPEVVSEQTDLLLSPFEPTVGIVGETVPEPVRDQLATIHHIWKPNHIQDGVHTSLLGSSGMRAQLILLVDDRKRLKALKSFLDVLTPYLSRTLDHLAFLERQHVQLECLEEVVRMTTPVMLVNRHAGIEWISDAARSLFHRLTYSTEIPKPLVDWLARRNANGSMPNDEQCVLIHGSWIHIRTKAVRSAHGRYDLITLDDPVHRQATAFDRRCNELGLTDRERDLAALIVDGRLNKEISRRLDISLNTVKNHVKSIYARAGVRNRAEFIATVLDG